MYRILPLILKLLIVPLLLTAQVKESFDGLKFTRPKGYLREAKPDYRAFTLTNKAKGNFCKMVVYKSVPGSGSAASDFDLLWKTLIADTYGISEPPQKTDPVQENGWEVHAGMGSFLFNKKPTIAMLTTLSGNNRVTGIVSLTDNEAYLPAVEQFLASVDVPPARKTVTAPSKNQSPPPPVVSKPASVNPAGIATGTTNFDDGWSSVPETNWVRVTKGGLTVLLHYGVPFDDAMRQQALNECWNRLADSRYTIRQRYDYPHSVLNFPYYYMEADVTEKATGKNYFLGFRVIAETGVAYVTEILAPAKNAYTQAFPDMDKVGAMRYYNRFAIHSSDLPGTWNNFSSAAVQLYNVYTGGNAGMNMTAINDEFIFQANGSYSSRHVGASSNYGQNSYFDQKYKGKMTVSHWSLTLTNRFNGKTEDFHAYYEAVRNGRILHLTNKQFSGLRYDLVKSK